MMPRKSAASLSVVTIPLDRRPPPSDDLTEVQRDVWRRVVEGEANGFFKTAATQQLLKEYCRHVEAAGVLAKLIDGFQQERLASDEGLSRYDQLLRMRERETGALVQKATKLRLTNQSRYTPQAANSASKNAPMSRPWESIK